MPRGSSPRVWGTFRLLEQLQCQRRFIPTCVGNIPRPLTIAWWMRGSSPRVWGTSVPPFPQRHRCRFIPTCVGNMGDLFHKDVPVSVHPHVCGEHLFFGVASRLHLRFIPTCVGNIVCCRPSGLPSPVHPHVCGEHGASRRKRVIGIGSSPRVWGTWRGAQIQANVCRFIPTCVGNISGRPPTCAANTVHPHVCGEHST